MVEVKGRLATKTVFGWTVDNTFVNLIFMALAEYIDFVTTLAGKAKVSRRVALFAFFDASTRESAYNQERAEKEENFKLIHSIKIIFLCRRYNLRAQSRLSLITTPSI